MKKFFAWFLGIVLVLITPVVAIFYNFKQVVFSPESSKKMLIETDFYNQAKSVIKKTMFESSSNSPELQAITKITNKTLDEYNFQPKVEKVIDDFYAGLDNNNGNLIFSIDLTDIKQLIMQNALAEVQNQPVDFSELSIPDKWQVDFSKSEHASTIKVMAYLYHNFNLIMIIYGVLVSLFLLFCILSGVRYLRLFFAVFLIAGILIFAQRAIWWLINPHTIFTSILEQGKTGLQLVVENLIVYFKQKITIFLTWESGICISISAVGLIISSFIGLSKVGNIPLDDRKNS